MPSQTTERDRDRDNRDHALVNNSATFPRAIHANLRGQPVTLMAIGDIEGRSPGALYVDQDGRAGWDSLQEFTITDPSCLPPSEEALRRAARMIR